MLVISCLISDPEPLTDSNCQLKSFTDPLCIPVVCKRYKDIAIFIRFVSQDKQGRVYDLVQII